MAKIIKKHHVIGLLMAALAAVVFVGLLAWLTPRQAQVALFTRDHPLFAPLIVVAWKIAGTVIPPIPGGTLSFALIPVLGWFPAYLYNTIGNLAGASIAFWIARRFREPVVARFVSLQDLSAWEKKLSERQEFLAFLLVRFTTGPVFDVMSYVLGLSRISFKRFMAISCIALIPDALLYYLGGSIYKQLLRGSWLIGLGLFVILVALVLLPHAIKHVNAKKKDNKNKSTG